MCGRYYIGDETVREIEKLILQVDKKLRQDSMAAVKRIAQKDIYPTQLAPVLAGKGSFLHCKWQRCNREEPKKNFFPSFPFYDIIKEVC